MSAEVRRLGFPVLQPIEAYGPAGDFRPQMDLRCRKVQRDLEALVRSGALFGIHCGVPCRTFSQLFRLFGSGTRTREQPEGSGCREDELLANRDASWMCRLLGLVSRAGGWFTIENPGASYLWHLPCVRTLSESVDVYRVSIDQCQFGLGSPPGCKPREIWKKHIVFLCSDPGFRVLGRKCCSKHVHTPIKGSLKHEGKSQGRSTLAAAYPVELCKHYARCIPRSGECGAPP